MDKTLTVGNPLKTIIRFAIPIYIGQLFQLAYTLIDTRIIGSALGKSSLAAVGSTTSLSDFLIEFLNGIICGFGIIISKHIGAKDDKEVKKAIGQTVTLGVLISVLISCACLLLLKPILKLLNVSEELMSEAVMYIGIIMIGLIAVTMFNIVTAILRAIGDSYTPLVFLIISNVINIGLDYLMVIPFKMGVRGAALATVISQAFSAFACFFYIRKQYPQIRISLRDLRIERNMFDQLFPQGMSMGFMISFVTLGSLALQTGINSLGTFVIVAHTAARKITMIFLIPFFALGTALATYCGQNTGAKQFDRVKQGVRGSIIASGMWCVVVIAIVYIAAPTGVRLITASSDNDIVKNAVAYLRINSLFYIFPAVICSLRNSLQGMGDTKTPLVSSLIELIGKVIIAISLVPVIGYLGVIIAEPIVWTVMVFPLIYGYIKKTNKGI
ncbi:MAG: MATE family efflux transporter [Lachnospiraceae bacterium]|nr:MATE family efflux transporter [Lachnospiraceae bacterium]